MLGDDPGPLVTTEGCRVRGSCRTRARGGRWLCREGQTARQEGIENPVGLGSVNDGKGRTRQLRTATSFMKTCRCNAHDAMRWDAWHEHNALQATVTQPRRKISYHISRKVKSWSYEYGKLYPGRYNTPPLREDLVPRSRMAPERNGRGREKVKLSCFFDKRVKPLTLRGWTNWKKEHNEGEKIWKHSIRKREQGTLLDPWGLKDIRKGYNGQEVDVALR